MSNKSKDETKLHKIISGEVIFGTTLREHSIPIVTDNEIDDIYLTLYSFPSNLPGQEGYKREDYRLYICGYNVTDALKAVIKDNVKEMNLESIKKQYNEGAQSNINLLKGLGIIKTSEEAKVALTRAQNYANSGNWQYEFETLGDRKYGSDKDQEYVHILYPFSFLYRFIQFPSISLVKVWKIFISKQHEPLPQTFLELAPLVVTFSEGPAPSGKGAFEGTFDPAGGLVYTMELSLNNPLDNVLKRIQKSLTVISGQIETIRTDYLDSIENEIPKMKEDIVIANNGLQNGLKRLIDTVNEIKGP